MDLSNYQSSNLNVITCGNYAFAGDYAKNDYLSKNFTGLGTNHY
jgi:hypothetical protein